MADQGRRSGSPEGNEAAEGLKRNYLPCMCGLSFACHALNFLSKLSITSFQVELLPHMGIARARAFAHFMLNDVSRSACSTGIYKIWRALIGRMAISHANPISHALV